VHPAYVMGRLVSEVAGCVEGVSLVTNRTQ
jgi:hypothetical protein